MAAVAVRRAKFQDGLRAEFGTLSEREQEIYAFGFRRGYQRCYRRWCVGGMEAA